MNENVDDKIKLHKLLIGLQFVIFICLFLPVYPGMYNIWITHSNNSHGILVPLISAFFLWQSRNKINWGNTKRSNLGMAIIILSMLAYVLSVLGAIEVVPRIAIVTTLIGLVLYHLGPDNFSKLSFPLFFLLFMVPVPIAIISKVSLPLQMIATKLSAFIIQSISIPVYREGNMLYFVNTSLEVAQACSGLRSLTAFLMLSILFAYLLDGTKVQRTILVAMAFPLAFLSNLFRVTGTGILAHCFGGSVARGFLHEFSGMIVFCFGLICLFFLYNLLNKKNRGPDETDALL